MSNSRTRRAPVRHAPPLRLAEPTDPMAWVSNRWLLTGLAVAAEAGHLGAAVTEWPTAGQRGVFHIVIAAGLGLLATGLWFGLSRPERLGGIGLGAALPACWILGALAGVSPYREVPAFAALALCAVAAALSALIALSYQRQG